MSDNLHGVFEILKDEQKFIEDTFYIDVIPTLEEIICPFCGEPSTRIHSHYARSFQDLPIQGKKVEITLYNRKVFCDNSSCNHTTSAERFSWLAPNSKKTSRLDEEIIRLSLNCSSIAASRILRRSTVTIGKSTVCTLLKKTEIIINKAIITHVCIDDFALKRREKYGTVMIDIHSHAIIDMIASREQKGSFSCGGIKK